MGSALFYSWTAQFLLDSSRVHLLILACVTHFLLGTRVACIAFRSTLIAFISADFSFFLKLFFNCARIKERQVTHSVDFNFRGFFSGRGTPGPKLLAAAITVFRFIGTPARESASYRQASVLAFSGYLMGVRELIVSRGSTMGWFALVLPVAVLGTRYYLATAAWPPSWQHGASTPDVKAVLSLHHGGA